MGTPDTPIPSNGGGRNVLVVSTVEEIGSALNAQLHEDDVVKVVVPVVGQGVLDWLANDEKAFSHAVEVADRLADDLPGETVDAGAGEADVALAIRDALANIKNYSGLASGPINFCADATPQCRDGNRTGILVEYTKGGKDFDMRVLARVGFEADFGL